MRLEHAGHLPSLPLERADPEFFEQTQFLHRQLSELAQQLSALEQIFGNATTDAARSASLHNNTDDLTQARDQLRSAAEESGQPGNPVNSHSTTIGGAAALAEQVKTARDDVQTFTESVQNAKDRKLTDKQRKRMSKKLLGWADDLDKLAAGD